MSSSFQSTAATNIYDSPVNTFVQPVRVLPKTGIMDLAETLASVNENLRPFLNQSITKGVEKEKRRATKDRIFAEINGGEVAKLSNDIRKKDGDDAARKIIGGSRIYRQQYEKAGVQLEALKFKGNFENAYDAARIDTGKVDGNGQPIFKFLREFSSDSDEFKNWRQSYLDKSIQTFTDEGIDPDIVDEFFIPTVQEELFNITNYATEKNQAFNFTKLQNKVPEVLDSAATFFVQGKDEEGGKVIAGFLQDFYNAGITGEDANKMYKQIVKGAFNKARLLVDPSKEKSFQLAEDFADRILRSIPYGDKDLTTHSTYLDEAAKFDSDYTDLALKKLKNAPKLQAEKNKLTIKTRWKNFNSIEITEEMTIDQRTQVQQQKQTEYKNLLNDPLFGGEEEQKYIQNLGESDNYNLLNEIIPAMENKISLGVFDGYDEVLEKEIGHIEMNHATLDDEAVTAIKELKRVAKNSKGLGEKVETSKNKIMKIVNDNLGTSTKAGLFSRGASKSDFQTSTKINFEVQKQVTKYFKDYIKNNNRLPSSLEIQKMEKQFTIQALGANNIEGFKEMAEKEYPDTVNPFIPIEEPNIINKKLNTDNTDNKKTNTDNEFLEGGMDFSNVEGGAFSEGGATTVDVSSGDTLSGFANDLDTSVEAIKKANGMTTDEIQIGDVLVIPEGITDPNRVDAPKFDMNKLITSKDHPFNPVREKHNFQVIYNIAKEIGIKFPELVAAQAMEETGFGKDQSADNNFLGLKATPSEVARGQSERKMTTEDRGQGRKPEPADFKTFDNIREMMMQYKKEWNDNFLGRKGIVNAKSIEEAIKMLQAEDYATNKDYDKNVLDIIDRAIKEGWF
jgi:LysM repeat protein|tara:strand:- start:998 stop:3538 length:2541 start_codon:yes stop_codon:yes gene_type:complete